MNMIGWFRRDREGCPILADMGWMSRTEWMAIG